MGLQRAQAQVCHSSSWQMAPDTDYLLALPTSSVSATSSMTAPIASSSADAPAIPERPSTLANAVNRNATAYSPYGATGMGGISSPYGGGMGSAYTSPYSRMGGMGGMGMGGYGSSMYGGMGMGGMGGMGGMYGGGMGGMYGGMGGMNDPNNPQSLTQGFTQSTQATFQIIESIVGAFGGFAQMLESTYMATHSSFFGELVRIITSTDHY